MAFIKVDNIVINTTYIAAVRLEGKNSSDEESVSLLIAIPTFALLHKEISSNTSYHYEWLDFTGGSAIALRDYFSSFNHVIDLLPRNSTEDSTSRRECQK